MDKVSIINVGENYTNPVITVGVGDKKKRIGSATVDSRGRLITATVTEPVLGFVKPVVEDETGNGALLSVVYTYSSPRELRENNILPLKQYIDCVGHPMIKSMVEEEESSLVDRSFNLVDSTIDESTEASTTVTTQTQQTTDPVSTPVNQDTTQPSAPSTPSTPTPPSTPPSSPPQNNPPQQGGYGGY